MVRELEAARFDWYVELGIRPDHLRLREHDPDELSHYSRGTADVEYLFPIGWSELEGIANRGDFDLTQHAEFSGEKLEYFDQQSGERYVPHVIEPAAGADRATLAFLVDAYDEEEIGGEQRTVLKLHPRLAPVKVAVLPLVRKDGQPEVAREIVAALRGRMQTEYDEGGSIGKRYRRQDEIGTPWCVTVDHQTLEDRTVTVRDRDSLAQERVAIDELRDLLSARLAAPWRSPKLARGLSVLSATRADPALQAHERRRVRRCRVLTDRRMPLSVRHRVRGAATAGGSTSPLARCWPARRAPSARRRSATRSRSTSTCCSTTRSWRLRDRVAVRSSASAARLHRRRSSSCPAPRIC